MALPKLNAFAGDETPAEFEVALAKDTQGVHDWMGRLCNLWADGDLPDIDKLSETLLRVTAETGCYLRLKGRTLVMGRSPRSHFPHWCGKHEVATHQVCVKHTALPRLCRVDPSQM